ncbi:TasA family protein [Oceanobacillus damuensis]|uniref:TasA family protein n=1 Tax=Oceanobacillus damuensis TaxID=937928 RepID=UPI00082FA283|nr:TasA family protein [Oceanobacillus damuensis]
MKIRGIVTSLLFGISIIYMGIATHSTVSAEGEITIEILPEEVLFNIDNMKPGDWAPRSVVIQNNGSLDFAYDVSAKPSGDTLKLYNELLLEIKDSEGVLFNGTLKDFQALSPRILKSSNEETLDFTIRFPEHLGNDFQGLDANFSLFFTAEGENNERDEQYIAGVISSGGGSIGGGSPLPETATSIFSFILIGIVIMLSGGILLLFTRKKTAE